MLTAMLRHTVARDPAKTALVFGDCRLSYGDLERQVARLAGALAACGVRAGDPVAVWLPNGPEFVAALFAVARARAILLPLYPGATAEEARRLLGDRPVRLLLADREHAATGHAIAPGLRLVVASEAIADGEPWPGNGDGDDAFDDPALYLYTSGSTDSFKRLCCTQRNLVYEARNFVESTGLGADDTILCSIPLHHSYGLGNCLLDAAYVGATLVLEPDLATPFVARHEAMLELLRRERVRVYPGVPFQYEVLAGSAADVADSFRAVRWCLSSGDMLPRATFERFRQRTGHPIRSLYGSTEAGSIAMDCGPAAEVRFGSLGRPLANVTVEVRGAGEIWVGSPTLPPGGYENRPDLNAEVFRDGFYRTGDVGDVDAEGRLFLSGRKESFVDVGGHKVDIAEVEEALKAHPLVREAAVVGLEVAELGRVLKAVVVAADGCRAGDVLDHCRDRLAAFKVPRLVEFREALPRSPIGKLLRSALDDASDWLADVPSARALPALPRARQVDWLAERVREQVAAILHCAAPDVPLGASIRDLGFDSLRAVELQERLSKMSGVALSITTIWNHASIAAYAAFLIDAIEGRPPGRTARPADEIDELSDDEVAAMLERELAPTAPRHATPRREADS